MAVFDPAMTINTLITQLCDLDATHTTELTTTTVVKTFENVFQINWGRGSSIRFTVTTNSMTPSGVRLKAALGAVGPGAAVISTISPVTAVHGAVTFTLTVNGFGLISGTNVFFGGVNLGALTYVTDQQGTISVPAANVLTAGTAAVQVQSPGTGLSNIANFIIT